MDDEHAKCIAYAWQLLVESQIIQELEQMGSESELDAEDWKFIDACLFAAGGNLLSAVVMARYGDEKTKLASNGSKEGS